MFLSGLFVCLFTKMARKWISFTKSPKDKGQQTRMIIPDWTEISNEICVFMNMAVVEIWYNSMHSSQKLKILHSIVFFCAIMY